MAFGFEGVEMVAGGAGGPIAEGVADFADGRGTAGAADAVENVREQFLLGRSQWFLHAEMTTTQMCGEASRKECFG